ncbi:hypothetical protein HPB47_009543, partial [Ixodes persulcatus]
MLELGGALVLKLQTQIMAAASVAPRRERWPTDPHVAGSNPGRGARNLTEAYCGGGAVVTDVSLERLSSPPTVSQKLNFDEVASSKGVSVVSPMSDLPKSNLQSLDDTVSSLGSSSPRRVLSFSSNPSDDSTASHLDAAAPPDPSRPPHPAGIVLTRPGYFTVPSLEDLANQTGADGRCVVDGFTVARDGYGNAYFPGRTDVTGLNLDEIVHFRRREIIIYPEDDDKPPVGEGLNRKAQVTLDCVWPNSKTTHEPITDPEKLKLLGYQEKLERATAKIGGRFLDYRPETGSWVFEVKHFSKYGLEDSDNEVDEAALAERPQQALPPPDRVVKPVEIPGEKHQQQMGAVAPAATAAGTVTFLSRFEPGAGYVPEDDEMEDLERSFPGRSDKYDDGSGLSFEPTPPATQRLAEVLGVSTESVQGMKASFFHADMGDMDDEDIELSFSHPRLKRALVSNREVRSPIPVHPEGPRPEPAAAPRPRRFSEQRPRPPSPDPLASRVLLPSSSATSASREATAMLDVPPMPLVLVEPVPLVQSFMYESQHLLGDIACTMGYRFRCGWGPRWSLLHLGSPLNGTLDNDTSQRPALGFLSGTQFSTGSTAYVVSLERVAVSHEVPVSDDVQKRNLTAMLEVQLAHSLSSEEAGSPVFVPKPGVEALHALNDLVSRLFAEMEPSHADRPMMQQLHRILGLCVALWGKTPGCNPDEDDSRTYAYMKARKEAFSDWLVQTTKQTVDSEVTDAQQREGGYLKAVMSHLSGHDVGKACSMARRVRDYRLGLLLGQGGYSLLTRGMLQKQLDHWRKFKHDRHIEDERLRVYALLAGLMIWPSSEKTINCCADLDWKRALALHLCVDHGGLVPLSALHTENRCTAEKPDPRKRAPRVLLPCTAPVLSTTALPRGSIHDAVVAYEAAFQDNGAQHPYAVPPYPPYYDVFEEPFSLDGERSDAPHDTCFHLLKLYCDRSQRLDRLLDPVTSVPSHLDYRI